MLGIETIENGTELTFLLSDRLDTETAPQLDQRIGGIPESVTDVVFDLKDLVYVSSAGLRVILRTSKLMDSRGGALTCKNASTLIKETFEMTGLVDIITIE